MVMYNFFLWDKWVLLDRVPYSYGRHLFHNFANPDSIISYVHFIQAQNLFDVIIFSDQSVVGGGFFNSTNQFGNANTPNQPQKTVCTIR